MNQRKKVFLICLAAGILMSACMTGPLFRDPTPVPAVPESVVPSEIVAPPTATDSPLSPTQDASPSPTRTEPPSNPPEPGLTAGCPAETEEGKLYINEESGYCLLYPALFSEEDFMEFSYHRVRFTGPVLDPAAMESLRVFITIETNGPADGLDALQYALTWRDWFMEGLEPDRETAFVGDQPAVIYRNIPAYGPGDQSAFVIANGIKYRINLSPQIGVVDELDEQTEMAWNMVTRTIEFFEPQTEPVVVRPSDVCPQPTGDLQEYIHLADGYCLLYPADFTQTPDFPGDFEGGPVLEPGTAWGDVRASLTVGTFGYFPDSTVMEVLEPRGDLIDMSSLVETTIAGHPAVTFRDPRGPWASRQAMIMVDGFVYTIVNQPWEPEQYPEGMAYFNQIWDVVTGSLAFFTPWR